MTRFVLVHGAWSDGAAWKAVAARLRSAGHQVAAPDLPAHGDGTIPVPQASLDGYAMATAKAAAALGGPVVLVGHHHGGHGHIDRRRTGPRPGRAPGLRGQFSLYGSAFVLGTDEFPLAGIPLQQMITKAETGRYKAKPARVFGFEEIVKAHLAVEEGLAAGRMVVEV